MKPKKGSGSGAEFAIFCMGCAVKAEKIPAETIFGQPCSTGNQSPYFGGTRCFCEAASASDPGEDTGDGALFLLYLVATQINFP